MTTFRADIRAAAVQMLNDYAADAGIKLQVYPGRPRSINTPTAFIDRIPEAITSVGPVGFQRVPTVQVVVLHGQFDSKDAADQADRFVDGFVTWVYDRERVHAAGANTLVALTAIEDDETYVPDWQPPDVQRTYFATVMSLEGFASE